MILVIFIILVILIFYGYVRKSKNEFFIDYISVPKPAPAPLTWNFESPKSAIKNFNEDSYIYQNRNTLQANTSILIGHNQPVPVKIYPYTFLNRDFDKILTTIVHQIEKDYNNNRPLADQKANKEWTAKYPYIMHSWKFIPTLVQDMILDVIREINRRFNTTPPIVDFRREPIKYYWISQDQVIVIIKVFKAYTACDIEYPIDVNLHINDNLKSNFERELLIYFDAVDDKRRFHLKFLRFPMFKYNKQNPFDELPYAGNYDHYFYLTKSRQPFYRMYTNTQARDQYLKITKEFQERKKYKCFGQETFGQRKLQRTEDQTFCELAGGYWDKQCEKDTDCPYFQANRNWPNKFGGCNKKTGYCEFPAGVKPFSYRKPLNPQNAMCYNCVNGLTGPGTIGHCCEDQKRKNLYLYLVSPDYQFVGDLPARSKLADYLRSYDMNWSTYT